MMDNSQYRERMQEIRAEILDKIDFKSGIVQEITEDKLKTGYFLDVKWKMNVHFILYMHRSGRFWYYAERNGENISPTHYARKYDDKFFESLQHFVIEIESGSFNFKKTISEQIEEIVCQRQLTSYMNNTKWKEFIHAMDEEMSVRIPCDYKTLFEEERENLGFCRHYDIESFNGYHFKSIEWVKLKPKFYECKHRGRLIEDEKIYYDVENEFIGLMKKYSIPYEYDIENELYTIYGYK